MSALRLYAPALVLGVLAVVFAAGGTSGVVAAVGLAVLAGAMVVHWTEVMHGD